MRANVATGLRRCDGGGLGAYDRLPPDLRHWLAGAALPWSPAAALRIWRRWGGDPGRALPALDRAEAASLARDRIRRR